MTIPAVSAERSAMRSGDCGATGSATTGSSATSRTSGWSCWCSGSRTAARSTAEAFPFDLGVARSMRPGAVHGAKKAFRKPDRI